MIIGVCGLGFSGSGAVLDLLKEYSDIDGFSSREMSICYYPDGIEDLDYHLNTSHSRYMSSDAALYAFYRMIESRFGKKRRKQAAFDKEILERTEAYIEELSQVSWNGSWGYREYIDNSLRQKFNNVLLRLSLLIHRFFHKDVVLAPMGIMHLCIRPDNFDQLTKQYLLDILKSIGYKEASGHFVVDQLFAGDNPEKSFKYFDDPYAIVVYRDPRDTYLLAKKMVRVHAGWIPTDDVRKFVEYYKAIYRNASLGTSGKVFKVQYEDLIYNYDATVADIEKFCRISNHISPKSHFDPAHSIRYTQLIVDYPQYVEDIAIIEEELSDFLYTFPYKRQPITRSGPIIL